MHTHTHTHTYYTYIYTYIHIHMCGSAGCARNNLMPRKAQCVFFFCVEPRDSELRHGAGQKVTSEIERNRNNTHKLNLHAALGTGEALGALQPRTHLACSACSATGRTTYVCGRVSQEVICMIYIHIHICIIHTCIHIHIHIYIYVLHVRIRIYRTHVHVPPQPARLQAGPHRRPPWPALRQWAAPRPPHLAPLCRWLWPRYIYT